MPLRQPLAQARRQQQLLLAITRQEVLRHPDIVLTPPDGAPLCNSLRETQRRTDLGSGVGSRANDRQLAAARSRSDHVGGSM
jgi:hypothetical protein